MPSTVLRPTARNDEGNAPVTASSLVYSCVAPRTSVPVPRVAMKALIRRRTTSSALTSPIPAPTASAIAIASPAGSPCLTISPAHSAWARPSWKPTEMSNCPTTRGSIAASASSAMTACVVAIVLALSHVGKMSGLAIEKPAATATNTTTRP